MGSHELRAARDAAVRLFRGHRVGMRRLGGVFSTVAVAKLSLIFRKLV